LIGVDVSMNAAAFGVVAARRVINDQLQLFVNDALVASAHDRDIARGQYGIATYRNRTTWESITVVQP
jgi:hypothetical protein